MKKQSPAWNVALVYYILTNLIALVPLIAVGFLGVKLSLSVPASIVYSLVLTIGIGVGALKISANNINRHYIVRDKRQILHWSLGYLFGINGILLLFMGLPLLRVLNLILIAVVYYIVTPRFLQESTQEEVTAVDQSPAIAKETGAQIGKGILKVALITIGAFIAIILIAALVIRNT